MKPPSDGLPDILSAIENEDSAQQQAEKDAKALQARRNIAVRALMSSAEGRELYRDLIASFGGRIEATTGADTGALAFFALGRYSAGQIMRAIVEGACPEYAILSQAESLGLKIAITGKMKDA